MREILFRGKTFDGRWEYGDLRHGGYIRYDTETYIMYADYALHNIPVIPKTIGQYTGLKDKNGKRIFEGDIIKSENSNVSAVSVVKYGNFFPDMLTEAVEIAFGKRFGCDFFGLYVQEKGGEQMVLPERTDYIEVIGNIHDNPELLEA